MDQEKWGEILDRVQAQFTVLEDTKAPGEDEIGEIETLIFTGPLGKIKLLWITRPVVLDKKIIGAHRRGTSSAQYEYIYSPTEITHKLEAYREVDGEWQTFDSSVF
ncbi:MAG: hypothetical protein WC805_03620 [Patescibacteria group bacterium]|jgi:hypothetical protein